MKIIIDGKAYVQLNDIMYLIHDLDGACVPASIFEVVFEEGKPLICSDENRYEFIEFDDGDSIEFFKKAEYSVDYLSLKDKSEEELIQIGTEITEEKNKLAKKYNEMSDEDKKKNQSIVSEYKMLEFKMFSIRDIVWMKQGRLKIKLPNFLEKEEKRQRPINKIRNIFKKR